jgi:hypothetical protein
MSSMLTEFDIIIGTTAVTRSDLHLITFPKYIEFIDGLNVLWIINIDSILNEDIDTTKQCIIKMCEGKPIKVLFNTSKSKASKTAFYEAAKTVINNITQFKSKYGVLWLEDDWECSLQYKLIDLLGNMEKNTYIQLVERNNEASFNPGVWSMDLFNILLVDRINDPENPYYMSNPERACVSPKELVDSYISKHLKFACFRDIGREWQDKTIKTRTFNYSN